MPNLYRFSYAIGKQRIPMFAKSDNHIQRECRFVRHSSKLYLKGLLAIREVGVLTAPDIYQHEIAYQTAALSERVVHVTDKPSHLLRPLFGRTNVAIAVRETAKCGSQNIEGDPRANHLHMLRRMDDVWCGSSFTQGILAAAGISARFLPPPVAHFIEYQEDTLSNIPCHRLGFESCNSKLLDVEGFFESSVGATVFLTMMSARDIGGLRPLVSGFIASGAAKHSFLLIKYHDNDDGRSSASINERVAAQLGGMAKCEQVVWCDVDLTDRQLNRLYGLSTFFVSSSSAQELNAPLIEAMARGMPVMSPDHTAMADYISDERSIVVATDRRSRAVVDNVQGSERKATRYPATRAALRTAFDQAVSLGDLDRSQMGARGAALVKTMYGLDAFERAITEFEGSIA